MKRFLFVTGMIAALIAGACSAESKKTAPELLSPFEEWDTPIHDGLTSQSGPTKDDLVGTWANQAEPSDTIVFERDGTLIPRYDDMSATWSTEGRILTVHYDEVDDDDLFGSFKVSAPFAIVDDMFFEIVLVRTEGSGSGIDGTWHIALQMAESYYDKDEDEEDVQNATSEEAAFVIQNAASDAADEAPTFTYTHQRDYISATPREDHVFSSGSGNVIVEDNAVFLDITEEEGEGFRCFDFWDCAVPSEEDALLGHFLGHRIADDIIVAGHGSDHLDWETFNRQ